MIDFLASGFGAHERRLFFNHVVNPLLTLVSPPSSTDISPKIVDKILRPPTRWRIPALFFKENSQSACQKKTRYARVKS